jgi:hypothetical protein
VWGYAELLEAMADPEHETRDYAEDCLGGKWNAEAFNVKRVHKYLARRSA